MNENSGTYLRIFEDDGSWISRPDYMLLAAMSQPDLASVEQAYSAMLSEDKHAIAANLLRQVDTSQSNFWCVLADSICSTRGRC